MRDQGIKEKSICQEDKNKKKSEKQAKGSEKQKQRREWVRQGAGRVKGIEN